MRFEIQERIDLSGTMTTVRIPERMLDKSALYTLQTDMPDFIVPFRYRVIDGFVEFTYEVERYTKLQYFFNRKTADEYVEFWEQLLQPLLDCSDWFLDPFSFVLNSKYLYVDKSGKRISYLYIPATEKCAQFDDLKDMVVDLYHKNPVMDQSIENKVLKAIMQGFQPKSFLKMLRDTKKVVTEHKPPVEQKPDVKVPEKKKEKPPVVDPPQDKSGLGGVLTPPEPTDKPLFPLGGIGDIVIDLGDGKSPKKPPEKGKKPKEKVKKEKGWGLFGKKEPKAAEEKELRFGTAMEDIHIDFSGSAPEKVVEPPYIPPVIHDMPPVVQPPIENNATMESLDGETKLDEGYEATCLRLVGDMTLPKEILVEIQPHQIFSIGRFDVTVGHKQSSFEFGKNTKAISRHHAAIERQEDGSYTIIDLSSTAGTFVQGQRLTPNVPQLLRNGYKVSFGTSGADYIWEET